MGRRRGSQTVNLYEAKMRLSEIVDRAAAGEEIVIAKAGSPRARLVPLSRIGKPGKPGGLGGTGLDRRRLRRPAAADVLKHFVE